MTSNDNEGDDERHDDLDELLTLHEVAELLRVPDATVRWWRTQHIGPSSFKIGRHVRYFRTEVVRWIREQGAGGNAA
jgi:excisionase family DNA binding protein